MEQHLLTIEETKQFFRVKDNRTIHKFRRQGLKCFKVGTRDYRFDIPCRCGTAARAHQWRRPA